MLIKRTKLTEKAAHLTSPPGSIDSPPELSHSLPTSDTLSETLAGRHRSVSIESGYSLYDEQVDMHHGMHPIFPQYHHAHFSGVPSPYEYDGFVEQKQAYGFPVPMPMPRRASTTSFASSGLRRSSIAVEQPYMHHASIPESVASDETYCDLNQYQPPPTPSYIPVEGGDRQLLEHFLNDVQRLIFPILSLHGTARQDVILPALLNNACYRHCCLSIAALHIKTTQHLQGAHIEMVDQDITRHRYKTISGLCEALAKDTEHLQILEATLGMILFQCSVGSPEDSLPDIPWHQHFQAAISLVNKLDLTRYLQPLSRNTALPPTLNMTLTAWIDILGATMLGHAPQFADTYREKHLSAASSGLRELMGCEDRVMYLISEIACLESLKDQGMLSDMDLCSHVESLAHQIDMTEEYLPAHISPPIIQSGHVDPRALTAGMTSAFRCAARIYLCSLVPGFDREQPQVLSLVDKLTACLEAIPAGPDGFDRSLVWPMLIGGGAAGVDSSFRRLFEARCSLLGEEATYGSFGRMKTVLEEVWRLREYGEEVTWREIMRAEGREDLLV